MLQNITAKKVVLLMNLGSPDSTSVNDVRKYLNEFLMDERVIDVPWLSRLLLVKAIIVPFRAPKSAHAYRSIWTENGSPLIHLTDQLKNTLQDRVSYGVEICMRYGNPSPKIALDAIFKKYQQLDEVILLPLYPHYAMSSYETAVEYAKNIFKKEKYPFRFSVVKPFYDHPAYINALAKSIQPYIERPYDMLLFSYHGIPERHIKKSDITGSHCLLKGNCCNVKSAAHDFCYRHQVFTATTLTATSLQLERHKYATSFQSRLGRDEWLKPYTAVRLKQLPAEGIKKLIIVCPAFVSDCLETIEEMGIEGRKIFLEAGGEEFILIPCLNTDINWIKAIEVLIDEHISRPTQSPETYNSSHVSVH